MSHIQRTISTTESTNAHTNAQGATDPADPTTATTTTTDRASHPQDESRTLPRLTQADVHDLYDVDHDLDHDLDPGLDLDLDELPLRVASLTNSPGCVPGAGTRGAALRGPAPLRRARAMRTVRTDAWAEPAAVSWGRTRRTVRKVSRRSQSVDWALPF